MTFPNTMQKRARLFAAKIDAAALIADADRFFAAERHNEALQFYQTAKHTPGIEQVLKVSLETGDYFLLRQSCAALGRTPATAELERVHAAAGHAGKSRYAATIETVLHPPEKDDAETSER